MMSYLREKIVTLPLLLPLFGSCYLFFTPQRTWTPSQAFDSAVLFKLTKHPADHITADSWTGAFKICQGKLISYLSNGLPG
jgi:hypothetical protein